MNIGAVDNLSSQRTAWTGDEKNTLCPSRAGLLTEAEKGHRAMQGNREENCMNTHATHLYEKR